jgi:hypothetical protein
VRCPVVLPDVRLDLDDPAGPTTSAAFADEAQADQRPRDLERRLSEQAPEIVQLAGALGV